MSSRAPRRALAALLFSAVAVLTATSEARAQLGDPIQGQTLFVAKGCVHCHAVRGTGGRIGPDLGRTAIKGSFFELAAGMWNHSPAMGHKMQEERIVRPFFKDKEFGDLIAFLYLLNYFDEPGDPKVGKVLFAQKHCIQCHRLGREGGTTGPPLDRLPRGTSPLRIAQDLWNHGPVMVSAIRRVGLDVPRFESSEIVDLFAYLRSHGDRQVSTHEFRSAGDPGRGKKLFASKGCARCHALYGRRSSIGPDLGEAELRGSVTQLAGRMWNHWPAMVEAMGALGMAPPTFRDEDMADLFAYLFLSRYDGRPGDIARGATLYRQRGCADCHGSRGEGNVGPSLQATTVGKPKEAIVQLMWNHALPMGEKMSDSGIPWPHFQAADLADLLALLNRGWQPSQPQDGKSGKGKQ
jgi:mono/diheme cytochrome c family protein